MPLAALLTAAMFLLCIAQIGPLLVLAPAVIWLYWSGDSLWGTVLLVVSVVVVTLDNVLRPILIRKGADLPLLLVFAGVIGGLISFGLIGIFVGPVVLAVTYTLLESWVRERRTDGYEPRLDESPRGRGERGLRLQPVDAQRRRSRVEGAAHRGRGLRRGSWHCASGARFTSIR